MMVKFSIQEFEVTGHIVSRDRKPGVLECSCSIHYFLVIQPKSPGHGLVPPKIKMGRSTLDQPTLDSPL